MSIGSIGAALITSPSVAQAPTASSSPATGTSRPTLTPSIAPVQSAAAATDNDGDHDGSGGGGKVNVLA